METFLIHISWVLDCFDDVEIEAESEADAVEQAELLRQFDWQRSQEREVRAVVLRPNASDLSED